MYGNETINSCLLPPEPSYNPWPGICMEVGICQPVISWRLTAKNEMHTHPAAQAVTADAPSLLLPEFLELAFTLSNTAALFICCLPFAARAGAGGSRAWLSHCGTQNAAACGNGPRQRLKVGRAAQMKS